MEISVFFYNFVKILPILMEDLLYIIFKGVAIGLLISAPMGPIGVLCIQRTLAKGRWNGFFTGVGASLSDLFYCLLVGLGMSFITDFVETNRNILQIIGSSVLLIYAIFLIRSKNTSRTPKELSTQIHSSKEIHKTSKSGKYWHECITGFFLTLSNPLITFLIIGLFTRFNFMQPEYKFYHYILGYLFIIIGALSWWLMITKFVDKVRSKFSINTMRKLNIIIGTVIIIMSLVGIFTGAFDYLNNH